MISNKIFFERINESMQLSRNQVVTLTKDQEFELSKKAKLPVTMRVGAFKVQSSIHAQARSAQRRADKSAEEWKEFARKIVRHIEDNKIKSGTYMFHSQSENQSVVASVKGREVNFVTVMPKGTGGKISKSQLAGGQKSALIESLVEALMISDGFQSMLDEATEVVGKEIDGVLIFDMEDDLVEAINEYNQIDESHIVINESKDMITKEFKDSIATFFNTFIEVEDMKFGSFAKKSEWVSDQMTKKTPIGRAAVMFAMSKNKDVTDAVIKAKRG